MALPKVPIQSDKKTQMDEGVRPMNGHGEGASAEVDKGAASHLKHEANPIHTPCFTSVDD